MDNIIIRKADLKDLEQLLKFEQEIIETERAFDPTLKSNTHYYNIPAMISSPDTELLVVAQNGSVIGCGYARMENSMHYLKHPTYAYLGFMYTAPAYRGKGINKKIIAALQYWTAARGVSEMRLEVYHQNEPAIRAYEKTGFTRHMIEMRKTVVDSDELS